MTDKQQLAIVPPDTSRVDKFLARLKTYAEKFNPVRRDHAELADDESFLYAAEKIRSIDAYLKSEEVKKLEQHAKDAAALAASARGLRDAKKNPALEYKRFLLDARSRFTEKKEREERERRRKQEEKLHAQQIEDAKKLAKQYKREGDPEAAKEIVLAAKAAPPPALPVARAVPKSDGFVTTTTYGFEIEHPEQVPPKYYVLDESLVRKDVNAFGIDANIPGVRVWEIKKEHTRGAA